MSFIEFKHIGKKYAGAEHKSVDDFNLNIEEKDNDKRHCFFYNIGK